RQGGRADEMNPLGATEARASGDVASLGEDLERARSALRELNKVGMALMSERDPDRLLGLILTRARRLTASDAGSLYLVVEGEAGGRRLHFLRAQNDSLPEMPDPDFTLPLDRTSVAGYAALSGEPLVIDDAYEIAEDEPYSFNRSFDETHGYRANSMLVVPMIDHRDRVVGVIQLINPKADPGATIRDEDDVREYVRPYTGREVELARSLAGQAAVSIENGRLYRDIENLFEGFVKAAVTAIDQRDPTTSGHSVRVTELTMGLAEVVNEQDEGRFADVHFTDEEMKELRYSGLLHDFGKIAVREEILVKRKKLPPAMWERLEARFQRIRDLARARYQADRAEYLEEHGRDEYDGFITERNLELDRELERIDRYWDAVRRANEPRVLPEEGAEILEEIRDARATDLTGDEVPFLTDYELHYLRIEKGSLDREEVRQIQSHVAHGYEFLQEIPWTEELERVDEIMLGHHEKLNGRGYPRGVEGEEIPLKTRMMTVADIFDALTASDRPYKKALPVERVLEILRMEAEEGALDPDLVDLFIEKKVYERVLEVDWREL
ncbi:MAG TPA: HD domain-containing phosphohydrolase, partial [Longimicrobiales bacterium]|nr:HD domain-containing phosphohydrolase [Longimicrobiales bacterium]